MSGDISSINHIFLDATVFIQANIAEAPLHQRALGQIQSYHEAGVELWTSRQVLYECLAFLTRADEFADPRPVTIMLERIRFLEKNFHIAEDGPPITRKLLEIVHQFPINGPAVYQAAHVAMMQVYGIHHLLTTRPIDYTYFTGLISILPIT